MALANARNIKHLLDNSGLSYAMLKDSNDNAYPLEVDAYRNLGVALYDASGNALRYVDRRLEVLPSSYGLEISKGNISGSEKWSLFGANPDVDNVEETVWSVGGEYTPPTAAMQMEIVSSSIQDSGAGGVNPAGTGIQIVHIHYLDDNFVEKYDTVTLDGTTVVTTNATDIYRIIEFHEDTVGTGKAAAGTIDLRHLANTPIYAQIVATKNRAVQAFKTVPTGKTVYLQRCTVGGGNSQGNRFMRFILSITQDLDNVVTNGIWYDYGYVAVQDGAIGHVFDPPLKILSGADVRINCVSDSASANALVAAMCCGIIEDN